MTRRKDDLEDLSRRAARSQNQIDPTRDRPPPWYVGANPRLMVAVFVVIGCLIVVRLISTVWLAEEAWDWWSHSPPSKSERIRTPAADRYGDLSGREGVPTKRLAVPPADPRLASAKLTGNPGRWFGADAYPADAQRVGEQGRTVAELGVDASGTPVSCAIKTSSASRSLDAATCTIALRRIQFQPARDERGRPIASTYRLPVRWVLPTD